MKSRKMIMIDSLSQSTGVILHYKIKLFDKEPLGQELIKKYTPTAGDRIFIYPDSNIPRFKLKDFCEKYKVSIAKAKETANVFFMNPDGANKDEQFYDSSSYSYLMYKNYFLNYIKQNTRVGDARYTQLIEDITTSEDTCIFINCEYQFRNNGLGRQTLTFIAEDEAAENEVANCENRQDIYFIKTDKQKESFANLIGKNVYHSDAMLALLNEGSVLDEEMYIGVMNLFDSRDGVDHKVAMEAMANCDYQKSAVYLLMIFYHNQNQIYNNDIKNHVNFKSFLKFFKLEASRGITIDQIIDKLRDKRLLNSSSLALVMKEAKKIITENIESNTSYFVASDIVPVDEIQKEAEETDAEEAATQPQATIPATLDSCPGAFQQAPSVVIGLENTQTIMDL